MEKLRQATATPEGGLISEPEYETLVHAMGIYSPTHDGRGARLEEALRFPYRRGK